MKTATAPDSSWEARLRWGTRRLSAELLDGRGKTRLTLGDGPDDDVAIGSTAHVTLAWVQRGLTVTFTPGVSGTLRERGDTPRSLGELIEKGRARESAGAFELTLEGTDELTLTVGRLVVDIRQARGRFPRLPIDLRAVAFIVLAVLAVGLLIAPFVAPNDGPPLNFLKKKR
jgi:hypothetical protein